MNKRYMNKFNNDLANMLDGLADTIDGSKDIKYVFQAVDFLREMAKYARNFEKMKGDKND